MTTLLHARPRGLEIVAPCLCSETHPEGRIGYREWARRNGRLGDIHGVDDRFDHHIDELMAYSAVHKGWPLMHDEPSALGSLFANR
jgi:hypothetical protein